MSSSTEPPTTTPTDEPVVRAELIKHEEVLKLQKQTIGDELQNMSIIHPYGYTFSDRYVKYHQRIQGFQIFEDDVFVATYMRSGITFFI